MSGPEWDRKNLRRPWMNVRYALYCRKDASFGDHHENLNEDKTHSISISGKNVGQLLVSGDI